MISCLIRPATFEDADAAISVLRASIIELCVADHQYDPPTLERWLANKTTEHFCRWMENPESFIVVAEKDSLVCGVGAMRKSGDIDLCYVRPGMQRLGIGRSLLCSLELQAGNWELSTLQLVSTSTARAFYEHQGYEFTGMDTAPEYGVLNDYHYAKRLR